MSNLSKRVQESKELRIAHVGKDSKKFAAQGSKGDTYIMELSSGEKEIYTPDGYLKVMVFTPECHQCVLTNGNTDCAHKPCKGNVYHTICKHCLGAIRKSFTENGWTVKFYETYHEAVNGLNFGGKLALVINQTGRGSIYAAYSKPGQRKQKLHFHLLPERQRLSVQDNINLMRGMENDGGID